MHAKNIGDRRSSSDDRQIAFVEIMKRANLRLPFQARSNRLRRVGSALHGHLRDSRQRLPLFLFGMRQIANNKDVRIIRNRQVSLHLYAPAAVGFRSGASRKFFAERDRKSTRLNSSHTVISYAVFCLKKKTHTTPI